MNFKASERTLDWVIGWGIRRNKMEKQLVYLAIPYTHADPEVREQRFQTVNKVAGDLINKGEYIYSPISHCHPISLVCDLPKEWEYWDGYCRACLSCCKKMYVLMLDGWKESTGVQAEIKIAEELGIEVEYIEGEEKAGVASDAIEKLATHCVCEDNEFNFDKGMCMSCGLPSEELCSDVVKDKINEIIDHLNKQKGK